MERMDDGNAVTIGFDLGDLGPPFPVTSRRRRGLGHIEP